MWTASARLQYRRSGGRYATDVIDAEFALIEPLLPSSKRGGRPRTTALREVLNAILYLLRTGCPWSALPREFPPKSTVYGYFRRFGQDGVWHRIWLVLTLAARERADRKPQPSAGIIDSPERQDHRSRRPARLRCRQADQRSQASSGHRHPGPAPGAVHPANVQDRDGLALACVRLRRRFPWLRPAVRRWRLPGRRRHCGRRARTAPARDRQAPAPRCRRFELLPRRWVIERTFAWLGRNRRLAKDFERLIEVSTAMATLATIQLLIRRLARCCGPTCPRAA